MPDVFFLLNFTIKLAIAVHSGYNYFSRRKKTQSDDLRNSNKRENYPVILVSEE